ERKYSDGNQLRDFSDRLQERLTSIPGVEGVAVCWNLPIRQFNVTSSFNIEGRPEPPGGAGQNCSVNGITPGYFKTLAMRVLAGRDFTTFDRTNQPPVVIINETMSRVF